MNTMTEVAEGPYIVGLVQLKATRLTLQCSKCQSVKKVVCKPGIGGVSMPRYCDAVQAMPGSENCGTDPFHIVIDRSEFVDQQQLKLQVPLPPRPPFSPPLITTTTTTINGAATLYYPTTPAGYATEMQV